MDVLGALFSFREITILYLYVAPHLFLTAQIIVSYYYHFILGSR
jgi:hypothetical protein